MTDTVEDKSQMEWKKLRVLENNRMKYGKSTEETQPLENELKYFIFLEDIITVKDKVSQN